MTCELYRHYSDDGTLLYVGISLSSLARLCQHRASPWFGQIATVKIERLPTRRLAEEAELRAIKREKPIWNLIGNGANQTCAHEYGFTIDIMLRMNFRDAMRNRRYQLRCPRCRCTWSVRRVLTDAALPLHASKEELELTWIHTIAVDNWLETSEVDFVIGV